MRRIRPYSILAATMFAVALVSISACNRTQPTPLPEYAPAATIKDLMLSIVDPSADVVWLSVTTVASAAGTVETAPKTDEEWKKVRQGAIALTEAANLLMMPGRHVAGPGEKSETPGIELEPLEMEALIDKDRASWIMRAKGLHDAGMEVLQAIDAKDAQKVFEIGEHIERACEHCHSQYWYPNEKIPPVPTELKTSGQ
jgi:hypothetical protein